MPQVLAPITAVFTKFAATKLGTFLTTKLVGRLLASVALSALQVALTPKPRPPGITTEFTSSGGTNPCSFILGTYATAGNAVCPPMSHGSIGKTKNAYLTYVIDLGDAPGQTLSRLILDGQYVGIGPTATSVYGKPFTGAFAGFGWVIYYDGTQTTADAMLLSKYGTYPERPWLSDMVLSGTCYAIVTFRFNTSLYSGLPQLRFEMGGVPLYDPRADSSVGGSGAQRWATPSTWTASVNPMVQVYNVLRGITLPTVGVWGGGVKAVDLPLAAWFAAMNECDVAVSLSGGGSEPAFRAGIEVAVDRTPAEVIEALLASCNGQIAEIGGVWKPRVGGPGLPVMMFTDDDIVISRSQELRPFPGFEDRFNAATATYPDPDAVWESKDAPPLYNAPWEVQDGGRRLEKALQLNAVPYARQVQRLMRADIAEERRFLQHSLVLPPDAAILEPLDAVSWTSARNGYTAKAFECVEVADDQTRLLQALVIRERDATDFVWVSGYERPYTVPSSATVVPAATSLTSFSAVAYTIPDGAGNLRRPAVKAIWDGVDQDGVTGVNVEVRLTGGAVIATRSTTDVAAGEMILSDGILAATGYEARGIPVIDGPAAWTAWTSFTTSDTRLGANDLNGDKLQQIVVGPTNFTTGTVLTVSMGLLVRGQIWPRGVVFEARFTAASGSVLVTIDRRKKYAGVFDAWFTLDSWTFDTSTTAWNMYTSAGTLCGAWDDFEYRIQTQATGAGVVQMRDVTFTTTNIAK